MKLFKLAARDLNMSFLTHPHMGFRTTPPYGETSFPAIPVRNPGKGEVSIRKALNYAVNKYHKHENTEGIIQDFGLTPGILDYGREGETKVQLLFFLQ